MSLLCCGSKELTNNWHTRYNRFQWEQVLNVNKLLYIGFLLFASPFWFAISIHRLGGNGQTNCRAPRIESILFHYLIISALLIFFFFLLKKPPISGKVEQITIKEQTTFCSYCMCVCDDLVYAQAHNQNLLWYFFLFSNNRQ